MRVGGTGTLKGGGTEKKGWETKILKRGEGQARSRGLCFKKRGGGWNPFTNYGLVKDTLRLPIVNLLVMVTQCFNVL